MWVDTINTLVLLSRVNVADLPQIKKKCPAVTFYQQMWILIVDLKSRPVFRIQVPKVRLLDSLGPAPPDRLVEPGKEQSADEG